MTDHSALLELDQRRQGMPPGGPSLPTLSADERPQEYLQPPGYKRRRVRITFGNVVTSFLGAAFAGVVVLELAGQPGMSPMAALGESFGRFLQSSEEQRFQADLCRDKQQPIYQAIAHLESDYGKWKGRCEVAGFWGGLVDGFIIENGGRSSVGQSVDKFCSDSTREYYETAIRDHHRSLQQLELKECRP